MMVACAQQARSSNQGGHHDDFSHFSSKRAHHQQRSKITANLPEFVEVKKSTTDFRHLPPIRNISFDQSRRRVKTPPLSNPKSGLSDIKPFPGFRGGNSSSPHSCRELYGCTYSLLRNYLNRREPDRSIYVKANYGTPTPAVTKFHNEQSQPLLYPKFTRLVHRPPKLLESSPEFQEKLWKCLQRMSNKCTCKYSSLVRRSTYRHFVSIHTKARRERYLLVEAVHVSCYLPS